ENRIQLLLVQGCSGCQNWSVVRRFLTWSRRRAGRFRGDTPHPEHPPAAAAVAKSNSRDLRRAHHWSTATCRVGASSMRPGTVGKLLVWLAFSPACSPAAPVDLGTDYAPSDVDRIGQNDPGVTLDDGSDPSNLMGLVDTDAPAICKEFTPCGGLLAGTWEMVDTCIKQTLNRKAMQIWGQTVMNLDTTACYDAVRSVSSDWKGTIEFAGGVANDQRMRFDTVDMQLSRS